MVISFFYPVGPDRKSAQIVFMIITYVTSLQQVLYIVGSV